MQRILLDTKQLMKNPPAGISGAPTPENNRHFNITIEGPSGTPFESGIFRLELFLPSDYPSSPPQVRFLTKIYHPNIDKIGRICMDKLKPQDPRNNPDGWTSEMTITSILLYVQSLLADPNPSDPLDTRVGKHWCEDRTDAEKTAREWTRAYA